MFNRGGNIGYPSIASQMLEPPYRRAQAPFVASQMLEPPYRRAQAPFVLTIFCVFAACVLLTIVHAGNVFANMNEISAAGRNERILLSYIRTKIRAADNAGAVSVGYFEGYNALFLEESFNGRDFITCIYLYEGWVRELFREKNNELLLADGVPLIRTDFLRFEAVEKALIRVQTERGDSFILPRSVFSEGI
ncbi:MAG: DUF4860 domain-containing protein [Defluviitaleaceae bacterium]|nr:DUF4860 domain-containing protein [Defluviitaleaceae bacterium]